MEIKTDCKFEFFNDGVCDIFEVTDGNKLGACKMLHLRFSDRTIGIKRFYEAKGAQTEITALIRIPRQKGITTQDAAVINDQRYKIVQVQHINGTNPPVTDLTLKQMGSLMKVMK